LNLEWTYPLEQVEFVVGYGNEGEVTRDIRGITLNAEHSRGDFTWNVNLDDALWMRVEVYDIAGNFAYTQPIFFSNDLPSNVVAIVSASPTSGEAPLTVSFDGRASFDPDGTIVSYDWNFDDGSMGTDETVSHTYEAAGTYIASLMVTDNDGNTDTDNITINVEQFIIGDLNSDGVVNEVDLKLCTEVVLGSETRPEVISKADLNQDGNVNVLDIQTIAIILVR
jgi:PKD repeat protein